MLNLNTTNRFEREVKRAIKRGKNLDKLWKLVALLQEQSALPVRYRNHKLSGNWQGYYECHIEPDWLLVYALSSSDLVLVATGTHVDLFD